MKSLLIATLLGVAVLVLAACAGDGPDPTPTYTLNVSVDPPDSGGAVAQDPEPNSQGQYLAGTVVKLTAGPSLRYECKDTPYWAFIGWSADVTDPTPTAEITIDSEKSVTAGFEEFFPPKCPKPPSRVVNLKDSGGRDPFTFEPADLTFSLGETVTLVLKSEAQFHTFTVEGLGIDEDVNPGKTVEFTHTFDKAGTYDLICIPHQAAGMTGTITVK